MPRVVDWPQRRKHLASAAAAVVAARGIDAATLRTIAVEAGCSTGPLAHYFDGRDRILIEALRHVVDEVMERMTRRAAPRRGVLALAAALEQMLPLDERRRTESRVRLIFAARAVVDPDIGRRYAQYLAARRELIAYLVRRTQQAPPAPASEDVADTLNAFVDGLALAAILEPERFPAAAQREMLGGQLGRLSKTT